MRRFIPEAPVTRPRWVVWGAYAVAFVAYGFIFTAL
jgi:hypothetical protein